ncbi:Ankyrin repeat domain-containing protein 17 [Teratosphaeria destructans]|uniref:Ankyrin repeat domain-containing protein 17 n=1 Tax=Teratosphaeria destructans TaxID=418781 RepID=A0A9W7SPF4_9PEZI|nr:Ankyrin repeat domain-containing protein 17 [Teratosphaeria destructans]
MEKMQTIRLELLAQRQRPPSKIWGNVSETWAIWLVTGRNDRHICQYLTVDGVSVSDFGNDLEYGAKFKAAQQHARDAVMQLRSSKNYSSDLAYYIRNSIESQSDDKAWIDVLCTLLAAMPGDSNSLTIRRWLREVGDYNVSRLVDYAWNKNDAVRLEIEELMQVLKIAYEPPNLADLAVLTQIEGRQQLADLIRKCSPVLQIEETGEFKNKVILANSEFRHRLTTLSHGQLQTLDPQARRYHGLMALRCFKYLKSSYRPRARSAEVGSKLVRTSTVTARIEKDAKILDLTNDDREIEVSSDDLASSSSTIECPYPIRYLFRHLSQGFPDVVQELCDDDPDSWGRTARLRNAWLKDYQTLTADLNDVNTGGMSALHVAAAIGAKELVALLVGRNGASALSWTSDDGVTALHIAAAENHIDVADAFLRAGANIEAGEGGAGTPLHLAAGRGKLEAMALLISQGASINASSHVVGPVLNAAILSGNKDAVKKIMDSDVRFDLDCTKCDAPLSLSARISEPPLFQSILESGREKWLMNAKLLDQALVEASEWGRLESTRLLLDFSHVYTNSTLEQAVSIAATKGQWLCVKELLTFIARETGQNKRRDVKLDDAIYLAAIGRENHVDILESIWKLTNQRIAQDVRDFSLYLATVMKKDATAVWLLETCKADANAVAEKPGSGIADAVGGVTVAEYSNALNAAASSGNRTLVSSLLDQGAQIDADHGYSLQLAASEGHVDVVELLLERGALVNKHVDSNEDVGFFSGTAPQAACENSRIETVRTLINHGANPNLRDGALSYPITAATQKSGGEEHSTPLINAAAHMSADAVKLLLMKGADVNAQNSAGDTALIMAAARGDQACVRLLCESGADVTYSNPQRGLAVQVAAEALHPLCASVLSEKMADMIEHFREPGSEYHELEKKRIVSMNSLRGETYESIGQQMKAIQNERIEVLKQLDAYRGQADLANDTISRLQGLLDEERATNAALRRRQGFVALQEEKKAAVETLELEQQRKRRRNARTSRARFRDCMGMCRVFLPHWRLLRARPSMEGD